MAVQKQQAPTQQQVPAQAAPAAELPVEEQPSGTMKQWFRDEGAWYAASFVFHSLLMCMFALLTAGEKQHSEGDVPSVESADESEKEKPPIPPDQIEKFELNDKTPIDPTELNTDTLTLTKAPDMEASSSAGDADGGGMGMAEGGGMPTNATGPMLGGLGGFDVKAIGPGPAVRGKGGVGIGVGTGNSPGAGGSGYGFGGRGGGKKGLVGGFGGTKGSERAVAAALNWLARHQNKDGSWALDSFNSRCSDRSCTGPGAKGDTAATGLALLPFLAAGQTHESKGPYRQTIYSGLYWMMSHQKADGDLRGSGGNMYAHGLSSIMLCEAFGLTGDKTIGASAQKAINFIQKAQNTKTGGWRYQPGDDGDTSVVGWQVMALKSAQMAYLQVDPKAFEGAKKWLDSVATGEYKSLYKYTPEGGVSDACAAVGMLCREYMGMKIGDPPMQAGIRYLMAHVPNANQSNIYYWYYATQVMHNVPGADWDTWNRNMRRILIESQAKEGCATGSWDPAKDQWGKAGGRIMQTSLATLTLEVYYRYLPLYKLNTEAGGGAKLKAEDEKPAAPAPAKPVEKPAAKPAEKPAAKPADKPAAEKPAEKPAAAKK